MPRPWKTVHSLLLSTLALTGSSGALLAQESDPSEGQGVPFQFQAGQPARADEINQNFAQLVSDMAAIQADMQAQIDAQQARLAKLEDTTRFLSTSEESINGLFGPHLIVEGANLHVRSGSGATDDGNSPLGVGNLILGYNEEPEGLGASERVASHTLVVGEAHRYTATGGIVGGERNTLSGKSASILGGGGNTASGDRATVSGGDFNRAEGNASSVSGGDTNVASGLRSAAVGGSFNDAEANGSTVAGGSQGLADGAFASVFGGVENQASGSAAVTVGGFRNRSIGIQSVVTGGSNISVGQLRGWATCNQSCF